MAAVFMEVFVLANQIPNLLRRLFAEGAFSQAFVPIQAGGTLPPFFCVHPAGGNVLCYVQLAREIGPDRPFYGLQSLGLSGQEPQETARPEGSQVDAS